MEQSDLTAIVRATEQYKDATSQKEQAAQNAAREAIEQETLAALMARPRGNEMVAIRRVLRKYVTPQLCELLRVSGETIMLYVSVRAARAFISKNGLEYRDLKVRDPDEPFNVEAEALAHLVVHDLTPDDIAETIAQGTERVIKAAP